VTITSAISNSSGTTGGVLGIMKDGNGTLDLTGANTYNGTTKISKGTLSISGSGSLGNGSYAGAIQFGVGANLVYSSSANQTLSGLIDGYGSVTQSGTGILSLVGNPTDPNSYGGDTTVNSGILAVNGSAIDDYGYLIINGGKVQATGVETVDQLYFGSVQKAAGTWGASGSGATHIDNTHFSGTGTILVITGSTAVDNTLADWITTQGLQGAAADATADPDGDGISNTLECILGGQPNPAIANSNSAAMLPVATQNLAGGMVFTFHRTDVSEDITTLGFQWSTGLTFNANDAVTVGATSATTNGVTVTVAEDSPDAATDTITITVPASKASGGKLFGRLQATAP